MKLTEFASFNVAVSEVRVPAVFVKLSLKLTVEPEKFKLPPDIAAPPERVTSLFCAEIVPELESKPVTAICGVSG